MTFDCKEWCKKYLPMTLIITVFMIGGTATVIFQKTAYQTEAEGRDGNVHLFTKPLFLNWCMFSGMSLCLFIYIGQYIIIPIFKKGEQQEGGKKTMELIGYLLMLIPAVCDFGATYLMNFGLIWVSSSIFQMMKGSIIIFTAILAVLYRKQKIYNFEITGVAIIVIALVVVGGAAFCPGYQDEVESSLTGSESSSDALYTCIGLLLVLIGQFLQALQTIVEEQLLHDISAPVTFVVGLEGIYGLIFCSVLMPIMGMDWIPSDLYEDSIDTFIMIGNNPVILVVVCLYIICIFGFNIAGMTITDYVNAMLRNVMEPLRMITVWIVSVCLYYITDKAIGEKLGLFTILEVFGFVLLISGFLLYTKVIKIPQLFNYPLKDIVNAEENENVEIMMEENVNQNSPLVNENDGDL